MLKYFENDKNEDDGDGDVDVRDKDKDGCLDKETTSEMLKYFEEDYVWLAEELNLGHTNQSTPNPTNTNHANPTTQENVIAQEHVNHTIQENPTSQDEIIAQWITSPSINTSISPSSSSSINPSIGISINLTMTKTGNAVLYFLYNTSIFCLINLENQFFVKHWQD